MKAVLKKSFSMLMAILMLLSCWVWVAPQKAEAASSTGAYYWEMRYTVTTPMDKEVNFDIRLITVNPSNNSKSETSINSIAYYRENWVEGDLPRSETNTGWTSDTVTHVAKGATNAFPSQMHVYMERTAAYLDVAFAFKMEFKVSSADGSYSKVKSRTINWTGKDGANNWYTDELTPPPIFPAGYDFYRDSYDFENYSDLILNKKYFTTMYDEGPGELLYKKKRFEGLGGLCFGMAYTTAAIYNGLPSATSIFNENLLTDNKYRSILREVKKSDKFYVRDMKISVDDYIKYAFVYQWSQESNISTSFPIGDFIDGALGTDMLSTVIGLCRNDDTGHAVLLVGYETTASGGLIMYVDDPNNKDDLETITVESDGSWEFSNPWSGSVDSTNSGIVWFVDIHQPFRILLTGDYATVKPNALSNTTSTDEVLHSTFIEGMDKVNADKVLLYVDSDLVNIECENMYEVGANDFSTDGAEATEDSGHLYWLDENKTVTISNVIGADEISLAGDNTIVSADVPDNSSVTMTVDENNTNAMVNTEQGEISTISLETVDDDNGNVTVSVTGAASSNEITLTQTDTGISVTGISDGTVTLSKDDEIIETQEFDNAVGEIEITYDIEGESDEVELDYHKHSYTSETTKTATCSVAGEITFTCSCNDTYTEAVEINRDNHVGETEIRNAAEATCTKKGYSGDTYCVDCQQKLSEGAETAPLGHSDLNSDNLCDTCGETIEEVAPCTCMCHSDALSRFIHTILCFFYKLFGMNQYQFCACGKAHW